MLMNDLVKRNLLGKKASRSYSPKPFYMFDG